MEEDHTQLIPDSGVPQRGTRASSLRSSEGTGGCDRTAFRELFLTHYDGLCRYAYRYVASMDIAEDLVQDVFLDLWRRRTALRVTHSVRAFLYGAVRNQAIKYQRRLRVRNHMGGDDALLGLVSADNPYAHLHDQELARFAEQIVNELPPQCRRAFILSREHGLTYAEIALVLQITVKTVEDHMGRALRHIRNRLRARMHG